MLKSVLDFINWITNGDSNTTDAYSSNYENLNTTASYYKTSTNLTKSSSQLYDNSKSINVNNYYENGAIPVDARNMTKDEATGVVVTALGYDRIYNTGGVAR